MVEPSPERIQAHLTKILNSAIFSGTEKLRRFLQFIVQQTLDRPGEPLKEIVIGAALYAPDGDFDPRLSASVRVDATRLRDKLRLYYSSEGAADPLVIDLPKGSYSPVFRSSATPSEPAPSTPETFPSVAVLPFSNLSPEQGDYFSDGLTAEIIHALSSVERIRVVARASSFAMKHRNADIREIGRALNVELILEGSVRISGERLRATVQLVNADDGTQVWSRRYDKLLQDIFAVQDEIASEVVNTLRGNIPKLARELPATAHVDVEAYAWYLRGRDHLSRQTRDSIYRAIECFDRALAKNPQYPSCLSGIAAAWLLLGLFAMDRPLDVVAKAREAARKTLDLDPSAGEALAVAACVKGMYQWDWAGAEKLFRQAIAVQPGSEFSRHLFTIFALLPMARIEESLLMVDEARRIDPLSLFVSASRAAVLLMARRVPEAEAEARRALEIDPDFWRAIVALGRCYEARGRFDDAIACYERATQVSDRVPTSIGALGRAYAIVGRRVDATRLLNELEELSQTRYISPYGRVLIYLGLEDDKVYDWLDRSCHDRAGWLMFLAVDPRFDPLRSDPRFQAFLRRINLPILEPSSLAVTLR